MKIVTRIMHDSRRPSPDVLAEDLAPLHVEIVYDFEHKGAWNTARRCWLDGAAVEGATHVLVVQDDAIAAPGADHSVRAAIAARPNDMLAFFGVRGGYEIAAQRKLHWLELPTGCCGLATCLPVELALRFVDWCDATIRHDWISDDGRMALFAAAHRRSIFFTAPSLFQHNPRETSLTTVGERNSEHLTPWFAKKMLLDWSGPALKAPGDPAAYIAQRRSRFIIGPEQGE